MKPLLSTALLSLALAAPLSAQTDLSALTEAERTAFRDEVRAYLLENPEVLMEAIGVLEQRQAEAQATAEAEMLASSMDEIVNDGYSFVGGNPDGDITLVEFLDYRCGYCKRAFPEVEQLLESDGNIRFIVKEFPILGEQSVLASRFAVAAQQALGNEAYKVLHDTLMEFQGEITEASLKRTAEALDLDGDAIWAMIDAPEVTEILQKNRALGERLRIDGTPSFVIEDRMVRGYMTLDAMEALVADLRS